MKGKFITIYGINNIGKSTHAKLLVERLIKEGRKAKYLKYPVYEVEPSGVFLNKTLRSPEQKCSEEELQMWFVLNRYQYEAELKRLLEDGYIVIAEDYAGTGLAWGSAKGLDLSWLEEINKYLLKEDFAILLEGKRDSSAQEKVHVHEQNEKLIKKCDKVHSKLADKYGWKRVMLQEKVEDTAQLIWEALSLFLD